MQIAELIRREVECMDDPALAQRIRQLLVEPYPVERSWDYGTDGEMVTCWTVLEHTESNTGIAYAEKGFGPANPWGLVALRGDHMNVGTDADWFLSLE